MQLKVTGMTCQNCVKHVTRALAAVPGVTGVSVDLAAGLARVEGDATLPSLLEAIREEGYDAAPV